MEGEHVQNDETLTSKDLWAVALFLFAYQEIPEPPEYKMAKAVERRRIAGGNTCRGYAASARGCTAANGSGGGGRDDDDQEMRESRM